MNLFSVLAGFFSLPFWPSLLPEHWLEDYYTPPADVGIGGLWRLWLTLLVMSVVVEGIVLASRRPVRCPAYKVCLASVIANVLSYAMLLILWSLLNPAT